MGKKWADFWEEQALTGWEAPPQDVMTARWRDMPVSKTLTIVPRAAPNYLAAIGMSALTKEPTTGLLFISLLSGGGAYRKQREKGSGPAKADAIATMTAAWEGVTEKLHFDELFKPAKSKFLKMMKIGSKYKIESDKLNITLLERKVSKKTRKTYWHPIAYFGTLCNALKGLVDLELNKTELKDLETVCKKQDELYKLIEGLKT